MNIAVVIPALNEAECLPRLIAAIYGSAGAPDDNVGVVVVDNGSTDATGAVAHAAGARVVSEPRRGYGFACAAGVKAVTSMDDPARRADAIVFLDGDYSFDPAEMPALLAPLRTNAADMVLGSRLLGRRSPSGEGRGEAMLPHQRFGNWLMALLMRRLYGVCVTDLGPYRAIRANLLAALDMREMTYGWPTEMIVKAARRRARIVETPVSYRPRLAGKSKVSGTLRGSVLAGYFIVRTTLRYAKEEGRRKKEEGTMAA